MNRPTYCRTSGLRIGSCKCLRCQPAHAVTATTDQHQPPAAA